MEPRWGHDRMAKLVQDGGSLGQIGELERRSATHAPTWRQRSPGRPVCDAERPGPGRPRVGPGGLPGWR
eukprot:1291546-Pyramimonas_sp.AAC.1